MQAFSKVLKALSDRNRLEIFILLSRRTLCVKALVNYFDISQSAVSQHLRVLREAGLVNAEKRGYWMHYSANKKKVGEFVTEVSELLGGERHVHNDKQKGVRTSGKAKGKA